MVQEKQRILYKILVLVVQEVIVIEIVDLFFKKLIEGQLFNVEGVQGDTSLSEE